MGGDASAVAKLDTFFGQLNATRDEPYDWSGNEPSEWAPWEFDYFGAPEQTQRRRPCHRGHRVRRRARRRAGQRRPRRHVLVVRLGGHRTLPRDPRRGEPRPGEPALSLRDHHPCGRPPPRRARPGGGGLPALHPGPAGLGHHAALDPGRRRARRNPRNPRSATGWDLPWLPASAIRTGGTLTFTLSATPDAAWGRRRPTVRPPSARVSCPPSAISQPSGAIQRHCRDPGDHRARASHPPSRQSTTVHWQLASPPAGLTVTPSSGALDRGRARAAGSRPVSQPLALTASAPGSYALHFEVQTAQGVSLPPVVLDVTARLTLSSAASARPACVCFVSWRSPWRCPAA